MLLIDDDYVNQVLEYTLAYCMQDIDMPLHAIVVEGNHIHRVDTDPTAKRPKFIQKFHSLVARQLNRYYKEGDAFFSNKPTKIVHNENEHDVMRRIVYTLGNPVADCIEREGKNHKGIRMRWRLLAIERLRTFRADHELAGRISECVFPTAPTSRSIAGTFRSSLHLPDGLVSGTSLRERLGDCRSLHCCVRSVRPYIFCLPGPGDGGGIRGF